MDSGEIAYIPPAQGAWPRPRCLVRAAACWGSNRFAVILPDDVIASGKTCLQQMVEATKTSAVTMVAAMEVAPDKASSLLASSDVEDDKRQTVKVKGMVEKPKAEDAPL